MPVYNGEKFLKEAIDSILRQTYTDFEFLIINDGSTDRSKEIIRSYSDHRIVYLEHEKNQGLIASLNNGLQHAGGAYIARMDADDVAMPSRLAEQLSAFTQHPGLVAVGSDYYLLKDSDQFYFTNNSDSDYIKTCLLFAPYFNHPTMMIKNIFVKEGLAYDKNCLHAEDYRLWTELAFHGTFFIINKPLLKYRSHASQISSQHRAAQHHVSELIRRQYLGRLGFQFSEEQFSVHNSIGNNEFIRSEKLLSEIDLWLRELVAQNEILLVYNKRAFQKAIHKFWLDSCGHSSLGLKAFSMYFRSPLAKYETLSQKSRFRLLAKCLVRMFKK